MVRQSIMFRVCREKDIRLAAAILFLLAASVNAFSHTAWSGPDARGDTEAASITSVLTGDAVLSLCFGGASQAGEPFGHQGERCDACRLVDGATLAKAPDGPSNPVLFADAAPPALGGPALVYHVADGVSRPRGPPLSLIG